MTTITNLSRAKNDRQQTSENDSREESGSRNQGGFFTTKLLIYKIYKFY